MTTGIEWTDETWNPVVGCKEVSDGCQNCYAVRMAHRLAHMPATAEVYSGLTRKTAGARLRWTGGVRCLDERLKGPLRWRKPRRIFACSMSDLFHYRVPTGFIYKVFGIMAATQRHTYQILTKRPLSMQEFCAEIAWLQAMHGTQWTWRHLKSRAHIPVAGPEPEVWPLPHVWLGVTVESARHLDRIDHLRECQAAVRFLSCEPLLGSLGTLDLTGIGWVIVGGESGPGARPMDPDWAREIRDQCIEQGVPFFFKQWGGTRPKTRGCELDGRTWKEMPKGAAWRP